MTALPEVVLALATLTPGDGRMGVGAAREPLARGFAGEWEGEWCFGSQEGRAELRDGRLRIYAGRLPQTFEVNIEGRGALRMTNGRDFNCAGAWREEGERLTISVTPTFSWPCRASGNRTILVTLKPAAPRKP
jgi:hypothetical protein